LQKRISDFTKRPKGRFFIGDWGWPLTLAWAVGSTTVLICVFGSSSCDLSPSSLEVAVVVVAEVLVVVVVEIRGVATSNCLSKSGRIFAFGLGPGSGTAATSSTLSLVVVVVRAVLPSCYRLATTAPGSFRSWSSSLTSSSIWGKTVSPLLRLEGSDLENGT